MRALVASVIAIVIINIPFISFQPLQPFQPLASFLPLPPFLPLSPFAPLFAQSGERGAADAMARRVNDRVRALQAEADRLALQVRTLLGDLRQLELQRDIAAEEEKTAAAAVMQAQRGLEQSTARLSALEQQRISQLPDLKTRLVDIYKRGRGGYARLAFDVQGLREFARAMRAVSALTTINEQRMAEHRRTVAELHQQRDALEQRTRELERAAQEAERARFAAQRAVAAREALITEIDQRRDLNAQLAGELAVAAQRLQQQLASLATGRSAEPVAIPIASFRGALDWPVAGRVTSAFGAPARPGGVARNGVEIGAPEGTPVTAVHPGAVDYADAFSGFGNLVILDHGGNYYSLYGYLGSLEVMRGQRIDAGTELGRVGTAPAGPAALYFELRVDGRSVDPLQWLKPR
jgi:septal ring factor EnvC (AmiA/AmiB activator)